MQSDLATGVARPNGLLVKGLTLIAALGGLLFGYDTAVISGAVGAIDANFIDPRGLSETAAGSLSGWTLSCALLGCVIGAALAGPISQRIGPSRGGRIVAAPLFFFSSLGSAWPEFATGATGSCCASFRRRRVVRSKPSWTCGAGVNPP